MPIGLSWYHEPKKDTRERAFDPAVVAATWILAVSGMGAWHCLCGSHLRVPATVEKYFHSAVILILYLEACSLLSISSTSK